jgi:hypothetical protein
LAVDGLARQVSVDVQEREVAAARGPAEPVDHRQTVAAVRRESFPQRLQVVVGAVGRQAALEDAALQDFLGAGHADHGLQLAGLGHRRQPALQVVVIPGEAIDEIALFLAAKNLLLEQCEGEGDWHDLAVPQKRVDQLAVLRAGILLSS